jgi:hypothetical protein
MSTPSIDSEGGGRELVAAVGAHETGGKPGISLEAGPNIRASFYLAQKFVDRSRPEFMKRRGEAT